MFELISILLVIIGWIVVHLLEARRDAKKEARLFAIDTAKRINFIERRAIKYHTNWFRDYNLEQEIKLELSELDSRFTVLKKSICYMHDISFLRSAITLENFESHLFSKQYYQDKIIRDISYHATLLRESLYSISLK